MSGIYCVHSTSINMFQNRMDNNYLSCKGRIHLHSYMWTLDRPTASLFAAVAWMAVLLNL